VTSGDEDDEDETESEEETSAPTHPKMVSQLDLVNLISIHI
jgi:hypothetical protein